MRLIDADALEQKMLEREERLGDNQAMWESSAVSVALDMFAPTIEAYTKDEVLEILKEIQSEIKEKLIDSKLTAFEDGYNCDLGCAENLIQEKIDTIERVNNADNRT